MGLQPNCATHVKGKVLKQIQGDSGIGKDTRVILMERSPKGTINLLKKEIKDAKVLGGWLQYKSLHKILRTTQDNSEHATELTRRLQN